MRTVFIWALTALTVVTAQKVSTSGRCGASNGGLVCTGSSFGNCCSQYGWCGSTSAHCKEGCDAAHGTCTTTTVPTTNKVSPDGSCGGSKGYTCIGATDGDCCSQYGYCGKTSAYCGKGCNSAFGKCNNQSPSKVASSALQTSTRSVAVTSPSSSAKVTQDGRCGNANGATGGFSCAGSSYGDCCSKYSYCGSTKDYCGTGCQAGFGKCTSKSASSSVIPSSSSIASSELSSAASSSSPAASSSLASGPAPVSSFSSSAFSSVQSSSVSRSESVPSAPAGVSPTEIVVPSPTDIVVPLPTDIVVPSPTAACLPALTNYVKNGDFETGFISPFNTDSKRLNLVVSNAAASAHSGSYFLQAIGQSNSATNSLTLTYTVDIPDRTKVNVNMWAKSLRSENGAVTFTIKLDGNQLGRVVPTGNGRNNWVQVGTGAAGYSVSGNRHVLTVEVSAIRLTTRSTMPQFSLDDISIIEIAPVGASLCASASSAVVLSTSGAARSSMSISLGQSSSILTASSSIVLSSSASSAASTPYASSSASASASSSVASVSLSSSASVASEFSALPSGSLSPMSTSPSQTLASISSPASLPIIISPTPSASATPACFIKKDNYIENGGYETGDQRRFSTDKQLKLSMDIKKDQALAHTGQYFLRGTGRSNMGSALFETSQNNIAIPAGTTVKAQFYGQSLRTGTNRATTFTISIDGHDFASVIAGTSWTLITTPTYTLSGNFHKLSIKATAADLTNANTFPVFNMDDVALVVVAPPAGVAFCGSSSSSVAAVIPVATSGAVVASSVASSSDIGASPSVSFEIIVPSPTVGASSVTSSGSISSTSDAFASTSSMASSSVASSSAISSSEVVSGSSKPQSSLTSSSVVLSSSSMPVVASSTPEAVVVSSSLAMVSSTPEAIASSSSIAVSSTPEPVISSSMAVSSTPEASPSSSMIVSNTPEAIVSSSPVAMSSTSEASSSTPQSVVSFSSVAVSSTPEPIVSSSSVAVSSTPEPTVSSSSVAVSSTPEVVIRSSSMAISSTLEPSLSSSVIVSSTPESSMSSSYPVASSTPEPIVFSTPEPSMSSSALIVSSTPEAIVSSSSPIASSTPEPSASSTQEPSMSSSSPVVSSTPEPSPSSSDMVSSPAIVSATPSSSSIASSTPVLAPTTFVTMVSSSSSIVVPSSSSVAPPCYSPTATNYISNPGFENSATSASPWIVGQTVPSTGTSRWDFSVKASTNAIPSRSGRYSYAGYSKFNTATTLELTQTITIDSGLEIDVGGYVKVFAAPANQGQATVKFTLLFDGLPMATYNYARANGGGGSYQLLEVPQSFVITSPGKSHVVKLRIEANKYDSGNLPLFTADDFYLNVVKGPNDRPLCRTTQAKAVF